MEGEGIETEPNIETPETHDNPAGETQESLDDPTDAVESHPADPEMAAHVDVNEEPKDPEFPPIEPGAVDSEGTADMDASTDVSPVRRHDSLVNTEARHD